MANKVLQWKQSSKKDNVWVAKTAAFQYKRMIDCFGRTRLRILNAGDPPFADPVLLKEYRDDKGAQTAARRWERKYGGAALAERDRIAAGVDGLHLHLDVSIILTKEELESYCLAYGLDPENKESVRSDIRSLLRERISEASAAGEYTWTVKENLE